MSKAESRVLQGTRTKRPPRGIERTGNRCGQAARAAAPPRRGVQAGERSKEK